MIRVGQVFFPMIRQPMHQGYFPRARICYDAVFDFDPFMIDCTEPFLAMGRLAFRDGKPDTQVIEYR
jgi:hypothetical protein